MQLILIRHPAPQVEAGVCYGSTDLQLQAGACQQVLRALQIELAEVALDAPIFSSPLQRAHELALALAKWRRQAVRLEPNLREMDFGGWEMRTWQGIAREEIDAWAADLIHYRPGGGENVLQMVLRIKKFIAHFQQLQLAAPAIVVCHAGAIRVLQAWRADLSVEEIALAAAQGQQKIAYGEVVWKNLGEI